MRKKYDLLVAHRRASKRVKYVFKYFYRNDRVNVGTNQFEEALKNSLFAETKVCSLKASIQLFFEQKFPDVLVVDHADL